MPLENLYFRHDFNARNNPKLIKLKMKLGMEGIGIYWCLLECLYELNGFLKEDDLETFCFNEHIEIDKVKNVLKIANFKFDKEKGYYSNGILERINKREEYCLKQKEKANKRWSNNNQTKEKKTAPVPDWYTEEYKKEQEEQFNKNKQNALDSLNKLKENK